MKNLSVVCVWIPLEERICWIDTSNTANRINPFLSNRISWGWLSGFPEPDRKKGDGSVCGLRRFWIFYSSYWRKSGVIWWEFHSRIPTPHSIKFLFVRSVFWCEIDRIQLGTLSICKKDQIRWRATPFSLKTPRNYPGNPRWSLLQTKTHGVCEKGSKGIRFRPDVLCVWGRIQLDASQSTGPLSSYG